MEQEIIWISHVLDIPCFLAKLHSTFKPAGSLPAVETASSSKCQHHMQTCTSSHALAVTLLMESLTLTQLQLVNASARYQVSVSHHSNHTPCTTLRLHKTQYAQPSTTSACAEAAHHHVRDALFCKSLSCALMSVSPSPAAVSATQSMPMHSQNGHCAGLCRLGVHPRLGMCPAQRT